MNVQLEELCRKIDSATQQIREEEIACRGGFANDVQYQPITSVNPP